MLDQELLGGSIINLNLFEYLLKLFFLKQRTEGIQLNIFKVIFGVFLKWKDNLDTLEENVNVSKFKITKALDLMLDELMLSIDLDMDIDPY